MPSGKTESKVKNKSQQSSRIKHGPGVKSTSGLCVCCAGGHTLENCEHFKKNKNNDRMNFLKERELMCWAYESELQ